MLQVVASAVEDDTMEFHTLPSGNVYATDGYCQQRVSAPTEVVARIKALCVPGTITVVTWDWFAEHIERIPV